MEPEGSVTARTLACHSVPILSQLYPAVFPETKKMCRAIIVQGNDRHIL